MDVNEENVTEWLNLCKNKFTMENIRFKVPYNYGDIDIGRCLNSGDIK